jgi:WD40 repeat protein
LWDINTGSCIKTFTGHGDYVSSVAFSPDNKLHLSLISAYPNPVKDNLYINFKVANITGKKDASVSFYNLNGSYLGQIKFSVNKETNALSIPIKEIVGNKSNGIIFYQISITSEKLTGKIIYSPNQDWR